MTLYSVQLYKIYFVSWSQQKNIIKVILDSSWDKVLLVVFVHYKKALNQELENLSWTVFLINWILLQEKKTNTLIRSQLFTEIKRTGLIREYRIYKALEILLL